MKDTHNVHIHTVDGRDVLLNPSTISTIVQSDDGTVEINASIDPSERKVYRTAEPFGDVVKKVREHRHHF